MCLELVTNQVCILNEIMKFILISLCIIAIYVHEVHK